MIRRDLTEEGDLIVRAVIAAPLDAAEHPGVLLDAQVSAPGAPQGHDLLVQIEAVSVNPVDLKARRSPQLRSALGEPCILGWDAAGTVLAVGPDVTLFKSGDTVYYAGSLVRSGSNAEHHLVDERLVGRKPLSLDFAQAAAMPLTTISAYEAIVERLRVNELEHPTLLVIGGAGGVGSMAIQIARVLGAEVVATASRPDSAEWCRSLGATRVIDHSRPLTEGLSSVGIKQVDAILNCADLDQYWGEMVSIIRPQGRLGSVVANTRPIDLAEIHRKSVSLHFEAMFARSTFQTPDMIEQHRLLEAVAEWVDNGLVRTTMTDNIGHICAANLETAHDRIEGRHSRGKSVLSGWDPI